jgi:hypothetical protein
MIQKRPNLKLPQIIKQALWVWGVLLFLGLAARGEASSCPVLTEAQKKSQPSWFPKICCDEAWSNNRGRPYIFDFQKYGTSDGEKSGSRYQNFLKDSLRANPTPRNLCYKKWTVLVAMDAANDLMPYSLWDLFEMESGYRLNSRSERKSFLAGSTLRKDLIVQHHGTEDSKVRRLHVFQSQRPYNPDLLLSDFTEGPLASFKTVQSPVIQDYDIADSQNSAGLDSKKNRFQEFVKWGMRNYPAQHYMVIYWGHGKGWLIEDDKSEVHLTGPELRDSLKNIFESEEGLQGKRRIDNFVADACYMQGLELTTEISNYTRFVSGSAQVQTFLGLPYRTLFSEMNSSYPSLRRASPGLSLSDVVPRGSEQWKYEPGLVAKLLPLLMSKHLSQGGYGGRIDRIARERQEKELGNATAFTFGTLDAAKVQNLLIPSLQKLSERVIEVLESVEEVEKKRIAGMVLDQIWSGPSFQTHAESRELGTFLNSLRGLDSRIDEMVFPALEAMNSSIVHSLNGTRYQGNEGFQSINIWFPKRMRIYEKYLPEFALLTGFEIEEIDKNSMSNLFGDSQSSWHQMIQKILKYGE